MATKTFEELKQLAIQIRDEKTNKQNTATRVGTAMLEHINKLEQDYYDKTQTDEELKERDDKLTELENNISIRNISKKVSSSASPVDIPIPKIVGIKLFVKLESPNIENITTITSYIRNNSGSYRALTIANKDTYYEVSAEYTQKDLNENRDTFRIFFNEISASLDVTVTLQIIQPNAVTEEELENKLENNIGIRNISKKVSSSASPVDIPIPKIVGIKLFVKLESPNIENITTITSYIRNNSGSYRALTIANKDTYYEVSAEYTQKDLNENRDTFRIFFNEISASLDVTVTLQIIQPNVMTKSLDRTANLFNYQDETYAGKVISDSGIWSNSVTFNTVAIQVEAGKTYYRYSSANELSTWGATNIRIFNGENKLLLKETGTSFTVPEDAVNPIAYIAYYINYTSVNVGDPSLYMVLESGIDSSIQIPYTAIIPKNDLTYYIKKTVGSADIKKSIVQQTGTDAEKVMSQKAVTDSLNGQKNSLQTIISNAIAGLTASSIEQGTGQSTTSTMSQKSVSDALAVLAEGITGDIQYRFAERPASGYENFLVDVDVNIATTNSDASTVFDSQNIQKDRCILALPTNYSRSGKPTRLVICGHGTGWKCIEGTTMPWAGMNTQLLLDEGYAVLGCNGTPGDLDGLDQGHNGTPQCYRSILAAYKYVTGKYNIATNGVLTAGLSMGTIMTTQIACFEDIPVLAQVVFSPSFELMKSQFTLKPAIRQRMCEKFGFVGQAPTFTTQDPPSEAEKQYVLDNFDKWCGYDTIINGISGGAKETFSVWPNHAVKENAAEKALYQDKAIIRRVPIKMFVCDDDTTASPRWADYLSIMMRNGGCYCEVRHYATGGHNAWGAGDTVEVSTLLGGKKYVNGASYEGLLFLKRFDL